MNNPEVKYTPGYIKNQAKYKVWVTCTYTLKPGARYVRSHKWITGCDNMEQAAKVKVSLMRFRENVSYIFYREQEPSYNKKIYNANYTDYRETMEFLEIKIKAGKRGRW